MKTAPNTIKPFMPNTDKHEIYPTNKASKMPTQDHKFIKPFTHNTDEHFESLLVGLNCMLSSQLR